MNSRQALRLADPARRLPPHHLDPTDEAVLQQILATDTSSATAMATGHVVADRRSPRRDWRPALITGIVAIALLAGTVAIIRTTSGSPPAPATSEGALSLEAAVQAKLVEAADGRDIDPDQRSLFWTQAQRGSQGDLIDLTDKTLYLAGACDSGGTVTIQISGEPDTALDCSTLTTIGPINLTDILDRQKTSLSIDVSATAGHPRYLVKEIALTSAPPAPATATLTDRGPQQYARGTARLTNDAYRYTVAKGDTAGGIAARFGTTETRIAAASRGGLEIFQGDILRITR